MCASASFASYSIPTDRRSTRQGNTGFEIDSSVGRSDQGEDTVACVVRSTKGSEEQETKYTFCLVEREFGTKKGCLMTSRIIKHEEQ